jgi:hypothetical protein
MTSALQGDRLDFLLERLAKDKPLPLDLDQKKDEPLPIEFGEKNDWLSGIWLSGKRWLSSKRPPPGKRRSHTLVRYLITSSYVIPFCIGVAATVAWESYNTPSTDQQLKAMSLDLAAVRQSVDELTAKVQQMAGDITAQQAILRRVSVPPPPAPRRAN